MKHCMKLTTVAACFLGGMLTPVMADNTQPLVAYSFENGNMTDDGGRYGFSLFSDAMVVATKDGNHLLSTGKANGYLDFGETMAHDVLGKLAGDYTISIDLFVGEDHALGSFCWAWAFSNGTGTYLGLVNAAGNKGWYYEIKDGKAQKANSGQGISLENWHTVTVVQKGETCTYYLDGKAVGSQAITLHPADISASLTGNYLARSPFSADAYMKNTLMDNFRIYDCALSADEVNALYVARPQSSDIVLDAQAVLKVARDELYLAQAANCIHNRLELPGKFSYADVNWTFTPYEQVDGQGEAVFENGVFSVTRRDPERETVIGELNGQFEYEGNVYSLYDEPVKVTVAKDDNAYGYLYCHMPNLVPETGVGTLVSQVITYALGKEEDKGLVFNELNRGSSIIDGIGTTLPWCRDAFMAKDIKRHCYYIVTTDLYGSRDCGTSMLENYSIGMFRSYDLINWTYNRCDMKQFLSDNPVSDIYDNSGTKLLTAAKVSRVWAPQIIFIDGDPYIYYAVGNTDNGDCDHFYISKANDDFSGITSFQMLYGANKQNNVLDADINYLETDGLYHMSYRDYAANGILDITTKDLLNPEWSVPVSSFQDGNGYEASSVFRRINDDVWNVGNVNYSSRVGYHFHTADALLRNLQPAADMSGHLSPQHGSFLHIDKTEYDLLQAWSDLKALLADGEQLKAYDKDGMLTELMEKVHEDITTDKGSGTNLELLLQTLQDDRTRLGAYVNLLKTIKTAKDANCAETENMEGCADMLYNEGLLSAAITEAVEALSQNDPTLWQTESASLEKALEDYFKVLLSHGEAVSVSNGDFNSGTSRWTVDGTVNTSAGVAEFFALRAVDYSSSIYKYESLSEDGLYLIKCQAFERNGDNDGSGRDYKEKVEKINYEFFAGDKSVPVQSMYALPYTGTTGELNGFVNTMSAAGSVFEADKENYANYLLVYVDSGRLKLGLQRGVSTVTSSDWCCFDNIEVYYLGNATDVKDIPMEGLNKDLPIYDLNGIMKGKVGSDGELPESLNKGCYIIDRKKVMNP